MQEAREAKKERKQPSKPLERGQAYCGGGSNKSAIQATIQAAIQAVREAGEGRIADERKQATKAAKQLDNTMEKIHVAMEQAAREETQYGCGTEKSKIMGT